MGITYLSLILLITCTLMPPARCDPTQDPDPEHEDPDHEDPHNADPPPGHSHGHWSYKDILDWDKDYPDCGGRDQSPINVLTQEVKYNPTLRAIKVSGYDVSPEEKLELENNGHTVTLKLPETLQIVEGLSNRYRAAQLHFHWGSHGNPGSEHAVNGVKFPGEIHVVHYSTLYEDIAEAQQHPGGLAVLAAFIEEGPEDNIHYQHLLEHLEGVKEAGQSVEIPGFDVRRLLPEQLGRYYRYNGSLTTPPCFQTVNWTIFSQTISLSSNQLAILEDTLHHDHDHLLQMNFRGPQSLSGRLVLSSFGAPKGGRKASGEGEMLAIIFGTLFGVTAVAFLVYYRRNRNHRSGDKPNVIYKATTTEDNMA
ncbi:carbonic anhydrase 9 [Gastrophryne carolinensis]